MHGITLTQAPSDWEIIQQKNGTGKAVLRGRFRVHPAAVAVGVADAVPVVRVMREEDNMAVLPWRAADRIVMEEQYAGSFETELEIPAGGLYRIETSLETRSTQPDLTWLYRGDCVLHVGVGNLFIIAGQSNSSGYSRDFCTDPPHLCVHLFRNRGKWDLACHPMNESTDAGSLPNEEMGIPGVSPYLSFAKKYYEMTGMPVGLIQTALGGSPVSRWKPGSGDLYQNLINRIHMTGGRYAGILWYQGCSDTEEETAASYFEHFKELTEALREELSCEIPFFTMQLNRQINGVCDEGWGLVREAQRQAALKLPGVYVLPTTNLSLSDGIHNSAQANLVLGERLAVQCFYVLNGGAEFEAPALRSAEPVPAKECEKLGICGSWLRLDFAHVKNCFVLFSGKGEDSGFTLEDERGTVEIRRIRANREDRNQIYLELEREPEGKLYLSFAWQADPVRLPPVDEVTYLPPLSFYRVQIR